MLNRIKYILIAVLISASLVKPVLAAHDSTISYIAINDKVYEDTEIFSIGWLSGLADEIKADPERFAFKPLEITAMEWDAVAHSLRHGKALGWRKDLTIDDCTFDKIENM